MALWQWFMDTSPAHEAALEMFQAFMIGFFWATVFCMWLLGGFKDGR